MEKGGVENAEIHEKIKGVLLLPMLEKG